MTNRSMIHSILTMLILIVSSTFLSGQDILYVDHEATGSADGSDWGDAYTDLQTAIDAADAGSSIWVTTGTYYATKDRSGNALPNDARAKTFFIAKNVSLYGGFQGVETSLDQRDAGLQTILSGAQGSPFSISDDSYHVLHMVNTGSAVVIDGFRIEAGRADGEIFDGVGGALLNDGSGSGNSSNPAFKNCSFAFNFAKDGGAIFNFGVNGGQTNPTFESCTFSNNDATRGGALFNRGNEGECLISFTDCQFNDNRAIEGGAMVNYALGAGETSVAIHDSRFINNHAELGGAIYNGVDAPSPNHSEFINTTFQGNTATKDGGAMYNIASGGMLQFMIDGCNFNSNTSGCGGAIHTRGQFDSHSIIRIERSQFIDNEAATSGGAIHYSGIADNMFDIYTSLSTFRGNTAQLNGGGINVSIRDGEAAQVKIEDSRFEENESISSGGAVSLTSSDDGSINSQINRSWFVSNVAGNAGGALNYALENARSTIQGSIINSIVHQNSAGHTGAISLMDNGAGTGEIDLVNNTIVQNEGSVNLSTSNQDEVQVMLKNNIIWDNDEQMTASAMIQTEGGNLLEGDCEQCSSEDPLFADIAAGDFSLTTNSPAINAGTNNEAAGSMDVLGNERIQRGTIDLGAVESDLSNETTEEQEPDCNFIRVSSAAACQGDSFDLNSLFESGSVPRGYWSNGFWPIPNPGSITQGGDYIFHSLTNDGCNNQEVITINFTDCSQSLTAQTSDLSELRASPNPFSDLTTLEISSDKDQKADLRLFDNTGKLISSMPLNLRIGQNKMPVSAMALGTHTGIIIVNVITKDEIQKTRIIRL